MSLADSVVYVVQSHFQADEYKCVESHSDIHGVFESEKDACICAIEGLISDANERWHEIKISPKLEAILADEIKKAQKLKLKPQRN
jgi:hypothetical protein